MKHNWQTQLIKFIQHNRDRPFEWGSFDCCLFVADAINLMTGRDIAADFRGRYRSKSGATRALKKYGKGSIKATFEHLLGKAQTGIHFKRGDICLINTPEGDAVGIYLGEVVWTTGQQGLVALSQNEIIQFWRGELCQ